MSESAEPEAEQLPGDLGRSLAGLPNADLLAVLDIVLLELEKRLLHYSRVAPELQEMADEGLVLSVRAGARLRQAVSSSSHAAGHLQVVGVGGWTPESTSPTWRDDPRVLGEEPHEHDDGT